MSEGIAAPAPAVQNGTAPRNNSGQFAPKAGATGVVPQEGAATTSSTGAPPAGPQSVAEWEGLEGEVDVYGEKQKVKWSSKAEALREAQELRAYRKRVRDIAEAEKKWSGFERLSAQEKAEALGYDPKAAARSEVLEAARMIDMTPEQRENYELKQEIARRDQQTQAQKDAEQQREQQAAAAQRRQVAVAGLEKGLELSGLPKTHHVMALLAEIQQECTAQRLPPLPPDLLAAEANKRYNERGVEPLKKLQGKALLERLGPEVIRAVLLAERERRGLAAGQPRSEAPRQPSHELPQADSDQVYGEGEAEQRLRAMRNSRR